MYIVYLYDNTKQNVVPREQASTERVAQKNVPKMSWYPRRSTARYIYIYICYHWARIASATLPNIVTPRCGGLVKKQRDTSKNSKTKKKRNNISKQASQGKASESRNKSETKPTRQNLEHTAVETNKKQASQQKVRKQTTNQTVENIENKMSQQQATQSSDQAHQKSKHNELDREHIYV